MINAKTTTIDAKPKTGQRQCKSQFETDEEKLNGQSHLTELGPRVVKGCSQLPRKNT